MRGLLLVMWLGGCGGSGAQMRPDELMSLYLAAVRTGDADAAYQVLSSSQKAGMTLAEFRAAFRDHRSEIAAQARALSRLANTEIPVVSEVPYGEGESATLALEHAEWRIVGGVADTYSLRSPQQALRSLRRALERRSYDGVMRILARRSRSQVDDEVRRLVDGLKEAASLEIIVDGDHARVQYEPGHEIELVREDGEWRVLDLD